VQAFLHGVETCTYSTFFVLINVLATSNEPLYSIIYIYIERERIIFLKKSTKTIHTNSSMEKPFHSSSCRNHHHTVVPPSPRLVRSRSGNGSATTAMTTPERSSRRFSSSERFTITTIQRSKSTSRTRTPNNNEGNNIINLTLTTSIPNKQTSTRLQDKKNKDDTFANSVGASKRTSSPSAWALSPGRWSFGSPIWPQPMTKAPLRSSSSSVGGSVNKVLKYFKQKKVSPMQEEEYHQFRVLHNRLLQWRFINARSNVAMANVKNMTEVCCFCGSVYIDIEIIYTFYQQIYQS